MKKNKYTLQKDLTYLSFSLFILVAAWVGFSIYHSQVTSTISDNLQLRIKPIPNQFDRATINALQTHTAIQPDYASPLGSDSATRRVSLPLVTPAELIASDEATPVASDEGGIQ